jgi:ADP-dependent NAD(P)H-hydrate dehydratase
MKRDSIRITAALLRRWPLPPLNGDGGKEERGRVLVVGGSLETPGAAILAAIGALRAGAGKLQIATSREVAVPIAIAIPEARVIGLKTARNGSIAPRSCKSIFADASSCDALLVGPGLVDEVAMRDLLRCKMSPGSTLIIDAGALRILRGRRPLPSASRGAAVVTPHAGEMANLWGIDRSEVVRSGMDIAREAAARLGTVMVLKGACTHIAAPDGATFHNLDGNIGLGTSGSGDALSGIIAGLAARGATPLQAAVWGVHLHAKAGDSLARKQGTVGYLARELVGEVPRLLAALPSGATSSDASRRRGARD